MDTVDFQILKMLKNNSRITNSEISKQVSLSLPAVSERIRKLEELDVIRRYTVKLNREMFSLNLMAFILVVLDQKVKAELFRETVRNCDSILECHHITGEYDYLLKVAVKDTTELESLISALKRSTGVARTNTIVTLSTQKEGD